MSGRVELEGALNFRDLGGYATPDGPVRSGLVYRSDNLAGLTDGDLEILKKLGLKAVYDFRNDAEVERQPSRLPNSVTIRRRLAIGDEVVEPKAFIDQILDGDITQYTEEDAAVTYQEILERNLRVMDAAAISLCRDNGIPIAVFKMMEHGNIRRVVCGERIGSFVS